MSTVPTVAPVVAHVAHVAPVMSKSIFFILGAGASVDSNLPTYRGVGGVYQNTIMKPEDLLTVRTLCENPEIVWDFIKPLYENIKHTTAGPTYTKLRELITFFPDSFIVTQNVDGFAKTADVPVIEVHGNYDSMYCMTCGMGASTNFEHTTCPACGGTRRPNVVLFGEMIAKNNLARIYTQIKRHPAYVVVIGTTLQFPYLRHLINKAKQKGSHVIHINPDDSYVEKLGKHEQLIAKNAFDGIQELIDTIAH